MLDGDCGSVCCLTEMKGTTGTGETKRFYTGFIVMGVMLCDDLIFISTQRNR